MKAWLRRRDARYDAAVLGRLLLGDIYATDMWQHIGGSVGAIYVALARLENEGLVWSDWAEQPGDSPPRRRRYGLTKKALDKRSWEARDV